VGTSWERTVRKGANNGGHSRHANTPFIPLQCIKAGTSEHKRTRAKRPLKVEIMGSNPIRAINLALFNVLIREALTAFGRIFVLARLLARYHPRLCATCTS